MIIHAWLLLVIVSFVLLGYSLTTSDDEIALVTSAISGVLWLVVAYGAMNLEFHSESSGDFVTQSEPALAILAVIGVLLCIVNVCVIVFDWLGDTTDDVNGA